MHSDELRALHRALLRPRVIEERMLLMLRQGRLSKWFSGIGQEAVSVGATWALRPDDWVLPMHRNLGVFTTRGVDLDRLFLQLLGRAGGFTEGRDRSFHFGVTQRCLVGMISHLAAMLPVACGLGLGAQLDGSNRVALAFTGDGATSEGDFHEAVNLAAVWRLPVVFIVENNQYALSTPTHEQYACERLADRGLGYGVPAERIDGNDVLLVHETVAAAVERARAGQGPTLIECLTFRMRGHEEASGTAYVPDELFETWAEKDPIKRFEKTLRENDIEPDPDLQKTLADEVRERVDRAFSAPAPESFIDAEIQAVAAPCVAHPEPERVGADRRYVDAISDGLRAAMRDDRVVLIGQDIAEYGGVFKVTEGFVEDFGKARVRNTPIIESGAIGAAMGLALAGYRPVVEMQFADFITCGFNQIVNNLAKTRYRWGANLPLVVRAPHGGGIGAGPYHSQSVEAWFTSVAGLKVVAPATPYDAKGLLLAAIEDPDPVLFLEHKALYRSEAGPVGDAPVPLGRARVARVGQGVTIVTYGVGVRWALEVPEVEVIDLRTLVPWDVETVLASVRKTGRCLVLHEAPHTGGFGGEIAATVGQLAFEWLDAPVTRLAALDTPVPFDKGLEALHSPRARLPGAVADLLRY